MPYNRVVLNGYLGAGAEAWSIGVNYAGPADNGVSDPSELQAWAEDILTAFGAGTGWPGDIRNYWGSNGGLSNVKCYYHPTPGGAATAVGASTGSTVAGSGTVTMPPQCAMVVSLLTPFPGRRTRGRFYMPFLTASMTSSLRIGGAVTLASRATSMASMLNAIGAAAETLPDLEPVIVSAAGGTITPVSSVRVGDVMDTQRRRRDALIENYASASV